MLEHFFAAVAAHVAVDGAKEALNRAYLHLKQRRPDLLAAANKAAIEGNHISAERVLKEALGEIVAAAGSGSISIKGAALNALSRVHFDHQNGTVSIDGAMISGETLVTGGSNKATGQTVVSGATLKSRGTEVQMSRGASIVISGNAKIIQT